MKKISLPVIFFAISTFSIAQKKEKINLPVDRFTGLDTTFERILKEWHAAGFAVAVVEKDSIVYARGFGFKDFEKKSPVTTSTLFPIGSCTKAFTASLLGLLQKEGKLSIDKPVREYLPALTFFNNNMNNSLTLRDLMCHRTGLPRHDFSWYGFPSSSRDSLLKRIQFMEPSFGIREKWQYNNFMFLVQGMVAEKLSGNSWEMNIREKLFKPLGMQHSNVSIDELEKDPHAALGYGIKKDSILKKMDYYHIDAMGPAGSINSNVLEMGRWVSTWINGGKYKGNQILPVSYVSDAISSQMVIGAGTPTKEKPDMQFSNYGFGWTLSSYKGHYRVEHGGNIDGFSASTSFFPTDSIGIIILTNQNGSSIPSIVRNLLADRMLQLPYFDWSNDLRNASEKAKAAAKEAEKVKSSNQKHLTATSHPLKDYEGSYTHPGYGNLELYLAKDSLFAVMGKDTLWLRHFHYDIFEPFGIDPEDGIDTTRKSPMRFQFRMSEGGDIDELDLPLEPALSPLHFKKTVKPKAVTKDVLEKYTGDYTLSNVIVKVYIKENNTLFVLVPGQPDYELVPLGNDKFALKLVNGYFVQFGVNEKGVTSDLTFMQPNGNFKATKNN